MARDERDDIAQKYRLLREGHAGRNWRSILMWEVRAQNRLQEEFEQGER